jgi:hypothetical protein
MALTANTGERAKLSGQVTDGGIYSDLARAEVREPPHAVGPTSSERHNTLRLKLLPVACWRVDDHRFAFDSSFLLPTGAREFALLAEKRPPGPAVSGQPEQGDPEPMEDPNGLRLTVFGHADPTGKEEYNQALAGRRAKAVYAVLVRDTKMWDELYTKPHGGDDWSLLHLKLMLGALGYDPGPMDAQPRQASTQATKAFQRSVGLPASGSIDSATRKRLFQAYMDVLCVDRQGKPFRYNRKDFLSRGEGRGGKADYQSCGEFNPVLVFSQEEDKEYRKPENKAERDADNASNRRVVVYLFPPEPKLPIDQWPCPAIAEGMGPCRARFWPDGDQRRQPQELRREHLKRGRTFACAWYDGLARFSCCEGVRQNLEIWPLDDEGQRMPNVPCRVDMGGTIYENVTADADGRLLLSDVYVLRKCELEWGAMDSSSAAGDETRAADPTDQAPASGAELAGEPSYDQPVPASESGSAGDAEPAPPAASLRYRYRRTVWLDTSRGDERHVDRQLDNLGNVSSDRSENLAVFDADWAPVAPAGPDDDPDDDVGLVHTRGTPKNKKAVA